MDFLVDNGVAVAAVVFGALVLGGAGIMGLAGFHLWRRARGAQRTAGEAAQALAREGERINAAVAALPDRQAELQASIASLQARAAVLATLGAYASGALEFLRAPLRYIGGR